MNKKFTPEEVERLNNVINIKPACDIPEKANILFTLVCFNAIIFPIVIEAIEITTIIIWKP